MQRGNRRRARERGFTYIGLLALVVMIGIFLARAGQVAATTSQREREKQLLFVGHQYRAAFRHFYAKNHRFPFALEELVRGTPGPHAENYLRQLYRDPIQPDTDWLLVPAPGGGVMGIASASLRAPLKTGGFDDPDIAFADADSYSGWVFDYDPRKDVLRNRQQQGGLPAR